MLYFWALWKTDLTEYELQKELTADSFDLYFSVSMPVNPTR